mgnify:CR=1 FL=1
MAERRAIAEGIVAKDLRDSWISEHDHANYSYVEDGKTLFFKDNMPQKDENGDKLCDVCGGTIGLEWFEDGGVNGYSGDATEVVIPAKHNDVDVTEIGASAFKDGNAAIITKLTIPATVTSHREDSFRDLKDLKEFVVLGGTYFSVIDGNLYNYEGTKLIRYAPGKYTTAGNIKKAPGVQYKKADAINENGEIVLSGLTTGRWSFMVQYNDDSYNFYVLDVE